MAKHRKTYAEYSEEYGVSESTVKGWVRRGKELAIKCPLDSPQQLRAWRQQYFARQTMNELRSPKTSETSADPTLEIELEEALRIVCVKVGTIIARSFLRKIREDLPKIKIQKG